VDPTIAQPTPALRQRPASGNGLIGGTGRIASPSDAQVVVAANGGSDLIYIPGHDSELLRRIVAFLSQQDYVGAIFVDSTYGELPGTLPLTAIELEGSAQLPLPAIAVSFKTFPTDAANPLMNAVQIADTALQEGQGMHGSFGRDNTFTNMAAIGPDFKRGYVDRAPVSNADIARTIAHILGLRLPDNGKLKGRVLTEALAGGPHEIRFLRKVLVSREAASDKSTVLVYQQQGKQKYFDRACFIDASRMRGKEKQACE
jgi:hypothetical protein